MDGAEKLSSNGRASDAGPLRDERTKPKRHHPVAVTPMPSTRPTSHAKTVVVIDDNHDAADSLADILRMLGYQVSVAYSGEDGIVAATRERPEIVISDIAMPGLDGYEVARTLASQPETREVFRIALTGFGDRHTRARAFDAGFHEHLTKPIEMSTLLTVLTAHYH
jgi:CheY-like chemotaxis protein